MTCINGHEISLSGLKVAKSANLTIPFIDEIEWFVGVMNSVFPAKNSANEIYIAHEESDVLQFSNKLAPSLTTEGPENDLQEQRPPSNTSTATGLVPAFGIFSISGVIMILNLPISF
jgi:hypothetical protein